jgi:shikimate dehydrogenase
LTYKLAEVSPLIKLALLGQGISHSLSPKLYREYLGRNIQYDLLDISTAQQIPTIEQLRTLGYQGLNITAPWKKHFSRLAIAEAKAWGAVNCIKITEQTATATNTDASALRELVPALQSRKNPQVWVVLGDGVMASIALKILEERGIVAANYSRKKGDDLAQLKLTDLHSGEGTKIVINACGRGFEFAGKLDGTWVFWDFNYAHEFHKKHVPVSCLEYIDGLSLLETQAQHAVKFWELQD